MSTSNNDTSWMNNVRVIATIAVIVLHVSAIPVLYEYQPGVKFSEIAYWHIGNLFDSLVRCAVPLFVMLSGALLLAQETTFQIFISKRFKRILLPALFWCFVYSTFNLLLKMQHNEELSFTAITSLYLTELLRGPSVHFWYIYMILSLYLFIPVISPWVKKASNFELLAFLTVWVVTIIIDQLSLNINNPNINLHYFGGYIGYLILGYFIAYRVPTRRLFGIKGVLYLMVGYIVTVVGTYISTRLNNKFSDMWYGYLTVNVMLASIGTFTIIKNAGAWSPPKYLKKVWVATGKYGLGIYFVHVLVLHLLSFAGINYKLLNPVLAIPLTTILCLILSMMVVQVINKLPLGKYVSG